MAHVTNKCIKLVKKFEGLYKKAYRDEVGTWTIGYGITMQINLSQEQR